MLTLNVMNQGTTNLLRRVAVATEETKERPAAGTELKVIEGAPRKILVQTQGLQFMINQRDKINDLGQRSRIVPREERDSIRGTRDGDQSADRRPEISR